MARRFVLWLLLLSVPTSSSAQESPRSGTLSSSEVETFTLANGVRVRLDPVPDRHFAALTITYEVGARDSPRGWSGLAHLSEHAMFSGTDTFDDVSIYLHFDATGAITTNAETNPDRTVYYELLPVGALDWALYVESQRMARTLAGLDEARVDRQREVVTSEGWQSGDYGWRGLRERMILEGTFGPDHPYASIIEDRNDVDALRLRHVQWFLQQHYRPDRAVISVVGGFDPETLRASIERYFGPIVTRPEAAPVRTGSTEVVRLTTDRRIVLDVPDDRDHITIAWPSAALRTPHDAALDMIASYLRRRIERELFASGAVYSWSVRQSSMSLGSVFRIDVEPMPGRSIEATIEALDALLASAREESFTGPADARAPAVWAASVDNHREDLLYRARLLGEGSAEALVTLDSEAARYRSVTPESLRQAMATWLPAVGRVVVVARSDPGSFAYGSVRSDRIVGGAR